MGLLAPLYIAGILAVALPVVFHLIRRTPQGRHAFSSLMFLTPSPPRLTRRSRLSNLLLLLLRAAVLALLAFAFARPFLQRDAGTNVTRQQGRRIAILVDASASMRRGDLWQQAADQVDRVLRDASPADDVSLLLFDRQVRPAFTFAEWGESDPAQRAALLRARLAESKPTWHSTRLGDALATAADLLAEADGAEDAAGRAARRLVLISDMQQGGRVETLQGHEWPANVVLEVRPVVLEPPGNAAVQLVRESVGDEVAKADGRLRLRVGNSPDSAREQLALAWADARGPLAGVEPFKAYVPPGRSQVVRVPWPPADRKPDRLVLQGDESDFDNTLFLVPPRKESVRVVYVGGEAADDTKGLRYYLQRALADTPQRSVEFVARGGVEQPLADPDLLGARLAVIAGGRGAPVAALRRFAEEGGDVLWVLPDAESAGGAAALMKYDRMEAAEAPPRDYAMIARVDPAHPLFAPFADSRFADFTKVRFWKHRRVQLPEGPDAPHVLASFDDGDPFLFERQVGRGRVMVATSGWHPADSQLALSTKFVPLMEGLLRRRDGGMVESQYAVGESIAIPQAPATAGAVIGPDGARVELPAGATAFDAADRPGVYRLNVGGEAVAVAVNLPADESRTAPIGVEELERWGARLATAEAPPEEVAARQRQLHRAELEGRQKLWRWVIIGVLGLIALETLVAGRLARRGEQQQQVTT